MTDHDPLGAALARAAERTRSLKAAAKAAASTERMLRSIADLLAEGVPSQAWHALERAGSTRATLLSVDPESAEDVDRLQGDLGQGLRHALAALPTDLPAALDREGLALDRFARHPVYRVQDGLITATVQPTGFRVLVQTRQGPKVLLGIEVDAVAAHMRAEQERLLARAVDLMEVRRIVAAVCAEVERADGLAGGTPVPYRRIVEVLAADPGFREDEFAVDLAALASTPGPAGTGFGFVSTKNPRAGLLLRGLESRGYFGFVSFTGEEAQQ